MRDDAAEVLEFVACALRMDGAKGRAEQVEQGVDEIRALRAEVAELRKPPKKKSGGPRPNLKLHRMVSPPGRKARNE